MKRVFGMAIGFAMLALAGTAAQAVTIGSLSFDQEAFADNASIALTVGGTRGPAQSPASGADGDFTTATNLNDSFVELVFTDNVLFNGPGADLVIFRNTNNNVIRVSLGAGTNFSVVTSGSLGNSFESISASDPGNPTQFGFTAALIDLSTLGVADGAEFTDGIFLSRGGVFTTVWDVAALNSRDVITNPPNPAAVPLPAAAWMLIAAIGGLAALGRNRA